MERDKSAVHESGGLPPPPSSRFAAFASASTSSTLSAKCETPAVSPTPIDGHGGGRFSHDIDRMPDNPPRNAGHRRAHSEILSLPDDISFDSELGIVGSGEGPSLSDETEEDLISMYLDLDKIASSSASSGLELQGSETSGTGAAGAPASSQAEMVAAASGERPRVRHQHSQSFDGSTSIKPELLASGTEGMSSTEEKKAMSAAKLAELALIDPKRAKRERGWINDGHRQKDTEIWANRQSAARSKERKLRYIAELERKILTLQTEATTLSSQLTMFQTDNTALTAENNELKLRLQTMEQQVHLQDALNETLRGEVQRLKIATGTAIANGAQMVNYTQTSSSGVGQQYYHHNHALQSLMAAHQLQQLHIHSQHQQQMLPQQHELQPQQQPPSTELKTRALASQSQESAPLQE
ncbi:probable transcription factor PosF21 isoform X1 [Musa acuminata AAA Group]|uniref:(wild Malaysian banana) hypothetical protein n=1 Tax=Musa acuminata subsp. malaccensis TaxID=214687 RepID=A0A804L633_MUSAM|nr:PREDICTED: probable transcription factor PosF21 isoform X1 [Musa acuminata subsp. malaccensis]CAG1864049.1 unnamed protein product [Musa acuminata subsp. malaccensis]